MPAKLATVQTKMMSNEDEIDGIPCLLSVELYSDTKTMENKSAFFQNLKYSIAACSRIVTFSSTIKKIKKKSSQNLTYECS